MIDLLKSMPQPVCLDYEDDLPVEWEALIKNITPTFVALDTETTGLKIGRDRLCLIQVCAKARGECSLIRIKQQAQPAPRLKALLAASHITKIFHYARFDMAALYATFQVMCAPVVCTKILSKIVRTYTEHHSLKEVCREITGIDLSKTQRSSYWGEAVLSDAQKTYAARDVFFLHEIYDALMVMARHENREQEVITACGMLPSWVHLDRKGFDPAALFSPLSNAV